MTLDELAVAHQETKDRSIRNEGRIKKLEAESTVLHKLATSVEVMAEQLKTMNSNFSALADEVEEIRGKPGKRWESLVEKVIWAFVAALLGYVISKMGL
jgi:hypothetical protein